MRLFKTTALFFFLFTFVHSQNDRVVIGKVSNGNEPLTNANIQVLNGETNTTSTKDGSYIIPVETGDVLAYHASGMEPISIQVEDVTRVLNIDMKPRVEKLRNVTVIDDQNSAVQTARKRKRAEKDLIRTAFGTLDKSRVSFPVRTMDADEILQGEYNLRNVLRGRFPGLTFGNGSQFMGTNPFLRRNRSPFTGARNFNSIFLRGRTPAIFDIDGQLFTDFPDFLEVQNIERIAVLPSLAGTVRYGTMGKGGVVIINTKTGGSSFKDNSRTAMVKTRYGDNSFDDTKLAKGDIQGAPTYLKELRSAATFDEAKSLFAATSKKYTSSPYFTIDAYQHFYERWGEKDYADEIVTNSYHLFENNAVLLKALAYVYESQDRYDKAYEVLRDAFILRPHYAQSYLDLANSNRNLDNAKRAAVLYTRYYYLLKEGFMQSDSTQFSRIINRDFDNLIKLKKTEVVGSDKIGKIKVGDEKFEGTRLVFEWNDSEAEFDLQFVNPNGQYYTWKHTMADNPEQIIAEKNGGYSSAEHLIYEPNGTWKINIKYLGNKSLTPTYLKATTYFNFGTNAQRKEVKVFKLTTKNVNQKLFSIANGNSIKADDFSKTPLMPVQAKSTTK